MKIDFSLLERFFKEPVAEKRRVITPQYVELDVIKHFLSKDDAASIKSIQDLIENPDYEGLIIKNDIYGWNTPIALKIDYTACLLLYKNPDREEYKGTEYYFDTSKAIQWTIPNFNIDKLQFFKFVRFYNTLIDVSKFRSLFRVAKKSIKFKDRPNITCYVNPTNQGVLLFKLNAYVFAIAPTDGPLAIHSNNLIYELNITPDEIKQYRKYLDEEHDHDIEQAELTTIEKRIEKMTVGDFVELCRKYMDVYSYKEILQKIPHRKIWYRMKEVLDLEHKELYDDYWINVYEQCMDLLTIGEYSIIELNVFDTDFIKHITRYFEKYYPDIDNIRIVLLYFNKEKFKIENVGMEGFLHTILINFSHNIQFGFESDPSIKQMHVYIFGNDTDIIKKMSLNEFIKIIKRAEQKQYRAFFDNPKFDDFIKHFRKYLDKMTVEFKPDKPLCVYFNQSTGKDRMVFLIGPAIND